MAYCLVVSAPVTGEMGEKKRVEPLSTKVVQFSSVGYTGYALERVLSEMDDFGLFDCGFGDVLREVEYGTCYWH